MNADEIRALINDLEGIAVERAALDEKERDVRRRLRHHVHLPPEEPYAIGGRRARRVK